MIELSMRNKPCKNTFLTSKKQRNNQKLKLKSTHNNTFLVLICMLLLMCINVAHVHAQDMSDTQIMIHEKKEQLLDFTKANIIQPIKEQYSTLSPKGKFFSTAFVGFATSRVTVKTTVKAAKYAGAAFIISEALNSAGLLDRDGDGDNDLLDSDMVQQVKSTVISKVNGCRLYIRQHCNMAKIKNSYETSLENDRIGTFGFTTGAVAALVL